MPAPSIKKTEDKQMKQKILLGLAALAMVFVIAGCSKVANVDKYVTTEVTGYDGRGTVTVVFDWDTFEKDYKGVVKFKGEEDAATALIYGTGTAGAYNFAKDCISYDLSKSSELSNGDSVVLKWNLNEACSEKTNLVLKGSDINIKVSGLEKIGEFDPFKYIEVAFSGKGPNGSASVTKSSDDIASYIDYTIDKNYGLSNGDSVTVTASIPYETTFIEKFGMLPSAYEKQYTVEGLSEYVTASTAISDEALNKMKKQTEDCIIASQQNLSDELTMDSYEYIGNYFIKDKDGKPANYIFSTAPMNSMYIVYKVKVSGELTAYKTEEVTKVEREYYYCVEYDDILQMEDGTTFVDTSTYSKICDYINEETNVIKMVDFFNIYYRIKFEGYNSLDDIYKQAVVNNIESYDYEDNITK